MFSLFGLLIVFTWNLFICGGGGGAKKKEKSVMSESSGAPSEQSKAVPPPSVTVPMALASKEKGKEPDGEKKPE